MSVSSGISDQNVITAICSDSSIAVGKIVQGDTTDTTNSSMVVKAATADTNFPIGVTVSKTTSADEQVAIATDGIVNVYVDGSGTSLDIGTKIVATTAGVGVSVTTADDTAQEVLGVALAPSSASGDIIPVLIARQSLVKGTA